jgi:hypothetical protein
MGHESLINHVKNRFRFLYGGDEDKKWVTFELADGQLQAFADLLLNVLELFR